MDASELEGWLKGSDSESAGWTGGGDGETVGKLCSSLSAASEKLTKECAL